MLVQLSLAVIQRSFTVHETRNFAPTFVLFGFVVSVVYVLCVFVFRLVFSYPFFAFLWFHSASGNLLLLS